MEFLSSAQSASVTNAKNQNERLSELGAEERSDEPTNSHKNKQLVCNIATWGTEEQSDELTNSSGRG